MVRINGYALSEPMKNANSGYSKWGFALKNGKRYFLKEFISPVYPLDSSAMSEEQFRKKRAACEAYEKRFLRLYATLSDTSHGNLTRIREFFRCDNRYYIATDAVGANGLDVASISALPEEKKRFFLFTLAQCAADLHRAGIVHLDMKPSNVMPERTVRGNVCAKLIDFDDCRFLDELTNGEEFGGDLAYLAPEVFLFDIGEESLLSEKIDIFPLGLMFHEYYCGEKPQFDTKEYGYAYEAALDGAPILCSRALPEDLQHLILCMLSADPDERPSAERVVRALRGQEKEAASSEAERDHTASSHAGTVSRLKKSKSFTAHAASDDSSAKTAVGERHEEPFKPADPWFTRAGDL